MPDTLFLSHPEILIKQGDIKMVHIERIEDESGDLVDLNYYCSDSCNKKKNKNYGGWDGCHEIHHPEVCNNCGEELHHENENADNSII